MAAFLSEVAGVGRNCPLRVQSFERKDNLRPVQHPKTLKSPAPQQITDPSPPPGRPGFVDPLPYRPWTTPSQPRCPASACFSAFLWPLIFVQLVALRDRLRARYGGNMPSWLSLSKSGCAGLIRVPTDSAIRQAAPASYETFGHDYSARLTRARLADVCAEEETPPSPRPALAFLLPRTQSGQAPFHQGWANPDTS